MGQFVVHSPAESLWARFVVHSPAVVGCGKGTGDCVGYQCYVIGLVMSHENPAHLRELRALVLLLRMSHLLLKAIIRSFTLCVSLLQRLVHMWQRLICDNPLHATAKRSVVCTTLCNVRLL